MSLGTGVFLYSGLSTDQIQIVNTRRLETALEGKRVVYEKIDGARAESKDIRDQLFAVSGQRGKYPQLFIKNEDESYTFLGLWEEIESLLDCDELDAGILASNPTIQTFKTVS